MYRRTISGCLVGRAYQGVALITPIARVRALQLEATTSAFELSNDHALLAGNIRLASDHVPLRQKTFTMILVG